MNEDILFLKRKKYKLIKHRNKTNEHIKDINLRLAIERERIEIVAKTAQNKK